MLNLQRFAVILFLLSFSFSGMAQRIGRVENAETGKPLSNVNIQNLDSGFGTVSNSLGDFNLGTRTAETDSIQFSYVGFQKETLTLTELKDRNFIVLLFPKLESLEDVMISGNGSLRKSVPYRKLEDMPKAVTNFGYASSSEKLFVVGGSLAEKHDKNGELQDRMFMSNLDFSDYIKAMRLNRNFDFLHYNQQIFSYDFATQKWKTATPKVTERINQNSAILNGKVYTFGGKTTGLRGKKELLPNIIEIYDPATDELEIDETNPHMANNFASFVYDSLLFVAGGSNKQSTTTSIKQYSNVMHVFNPETGFWRELSYLPQPKEVNGVLAGDKFYFIGGEQNDALAFVESYDLKTGKWKRHGRIFENMRKPSLAFDGTYIYIYDHGKLLSYNPMTEELKQYNIDLDEREPGIAYRDDKLYIFGGFIAREFEYFPSSHLYEIPLSELVRTRIQREKTLGGSY